MNWMNLRAGLEEMVEREISDPAGNRTPYSRTIPGPGVHMIVQEQPHDTQDSTSKFRGNCPSSGTMWSPSNPTSLSQSMI
jgi:hypothetical protein